ncbi:MAG TPA: ABC transporter permease [Anaerolineaceae bacterium]|jgi:lipopolysaccharide transport system permease protein
MASTTAADDVIYLRPRRGWTDLNLREMWRYRELLYFLTWRDIKVRYKQAALGVAWAVIQPLVNIVIFTFIFGGLFGLSKGGVNYPLLSAAGLLPWNLFASALQRSSISLVGNSNLLTKVYFPRLIIPISSVLSGLVDFAISFLVVLGLMIYYQAPLTWNLLWLLPLTLLVLITGLAVGLWLSALNVQYRDVQQMVPFLITTWMYASPVAYSANLVTGQTMRIIYGLNPMAGVIQSFRWAIMGDPPPGELFIASIVMVVVLFVTGLFYFRRMEKTFADLV